MIDELTLHQFVNRLKEKTPTPGGGGVSAFNSAEGAALIMMVANYTVGNEKYSEWNEVCKNAITELDAICEELVKGVDADAEAFTKIKEDVKAATEAPLKVMELSVRALEINQNLLGKSNPLLESDLIVAAESLKSGLISAKYNVYANIPSLEKVDSDCAREIKNKADSLASDGLKLFDKII